VSSEVVDSITYSCANCLAQLDAPTGNWDGWVRCSACGRLFLPSEFERLPQLSKGPRGPAFGTPNGAVDQVVPPFSGRMSHTSPARLIFTTGFVLCLLLTLIKFLDFSPGGMAIFGFLTLVFFFLLMRTPRKRLPPAGATWARSQVESSAQNDSSPISSL
jgi:hypothetical protein